MKKLLGVLLTSAAFAAPASAGIVGGIDFGVIGDLGVHLDTATLAQTYVSGNGQSATAYGFVTSINGDTTYCADGSSNCSLYYVTQLSGSQAFSGGYVEFTSATTTLYYAGLANFNLQSQSSASNLATITGLTKWVTLKGHSNLGTNNNGVPASANAVLNGVGTFTGGSLSGAGFGLLDVVTGVAGDGLVAVEDYLNSNGELDAVGGKADITYTSSFNNSVLNLFDVASGAAAGCTNGTAAVGAWCYQGTSNIRGKTNPVSEPASLALVALSLVGLAGSLRRRK